MNKAALIRDLGAKGLSSREIQQKAQCSDAYVRVVLRQRVDGKRSVHDQKRQEKIYANGDRDAARTASRRAYREARAAGATSYEAIKARGQAYSRSLYHSGSAAIKKVKTHDATATD
jgi:hypothetical protein